LVEEPKYEVLTKIEEIEIRKYPRMLLATARGDSDLFGMLFRYISGANKGSTKISMTAPVITPEKIDMTSPVFTQGDAMSFVTPSSYSRETIPEPTDPRISIEELPPRKLAVLRFSGFARQSTVEREKERLLETLARNGLKTRGEVILMRYNPPLTPWFLRRNEVAVELE
jgi:effector-binding domain-containing protein